MGNLHWCAGVLDARATVCATAHSEGYFYLQLSARVRSEEVALALVEALGGTVAKRTTKGYWGETEQWEYRIIGEDAISMLIELADYFVGSYLRDRAKFLLDTADASVMQRGWQKMIGHDFRKLFPPKERTKKCQKQSTSHGTSPAPSSLSSDTKPTTR